MSKRTGPIEKAARVNDAGAVLQHSSGGVPSHRALLQRPGDFGLVMVAGLSLCLNAFAHDLAGDPAHWHSEESVRTSGNLVPAWFLAQAVPTPQRARPSPASFQTPRPSQAASFAAFAPRVRVRWDENHLYIEDNGIPTHGMMVGITAWQQQVPVPQPYFGENAWRIPLHPVPAQQPVSIRGRFLRGAIAIAANGIPIFNPQNNRGELSQEIGELDQWGGHCGRADDYHYHAAPLHLQTVLGKGQPIAYALDGYPIHGLTEPDGSQPQSLDAYNGHFTSVLGYHYHASTRYPYVNGGFHGEVTERGGQVDPQPRAQPVRQDRPPLRGATITGFTASPDDRSFNLKFTVNGMPAAVNYAASPAGGWNFQYIGTDGSTREEIGRADGGLDGGRRGDRGGDRFPQSDAPPRIQPDDGARSPKTYPDPAITYTPKRTGSFVLHSPAVTQGGTLPVKFTGDGEAATLPLEWRGAPASTRSYALIMDHRDPEGNAKWYWTLYNIPANVSSLPKNVRGTGIPGNNSINGRLEYAPPHSKGPGAKTYVLTLYALSSPLRLSAEPSEVNRAVLLTAMKDLILDSAVLKVVYTRSGAADGPGNDRDPGGPGRGPGDRSRVESPDATTASTTL